MLGLLVIVVAAGTGVGGLVQPRLAEQFNDLCGLRICSCTDTVLRCNCDSSMQDLTLSSTGNIYLPPVAKMIEIQGCRKILIEPYAMAKMAFLKNVDFKSIEKIEFKQYGFSWGMTQYDYQQREGIIIRIQNATMDTLLTNTFNGNIKSISFDSCKIGNVQAFAFSNLRDTEIIRFKNTSIGIFEGQAFKKFSLQNFEVVDCQIGTLSSRALINIEVKEEVNFENVVIELIQSLSVGVTGLKSFRLQNSAIQRVMGEAFKVTTKGPVFINDNILSNLEQGAFAGISGDLKWLEVKGKPELIFENNTLTQFVEKSLQLDTKTLKPRIDRINMNLTCNCKQLDFWVNKLLYFTDPKQKVNDVGKLMWCVNKRYKVIEDFYRGHCAPGAYTKVYIACGTIAVLFLIILIGGGYILYKKRMKRYRNVPTNDPTNNRHSMISNASNHTFVVPESKTYKETELQVFVEKLEPIHDYDPPKVDPSALNISQVT